MRFIFTFVREKVKFVREKSGKCQGISKGPVCGNHAKCKYENYIYTQNVSMRTLFTRKM